MTRFTALLAASLLAASPALAQQVSNEAPPENAAPPPAASLVAQPAPIAAPAPAPVTPAASTAPAAAADPAIYQVLRSGDRQMTCDALGAEANALNAELQAEQVEAAKRAKKAKAGKGLLGGATGGVLAAGARYGLARGMLGGAISPLAAQAAVAATDSVAMSAGQVVANSGDTGVAPTVSPKQQRMNHLLSLYNQKEC